MQHANLMILSISCCMLWVRVSLSLLRLFQGARVKECPLLRVACFFEDSYFLSPFRHARFLTHCLFPFAERWHELSGVSQRLD